MPISALARKKLGLPMSSPILEDKGNWTSRPLFRPTIPSSPPPRPASPEKGKANNGTEKSPATTKLVATAPAKPTTVVRPSAEVSLFAPKNTITAKPTIVVSANPAIASVPRGTVVEKSILPTATVPVPPPAKSERASSSEAPQNKGAVMSFDPHRVMPFKGQPRGDELDQSFIQSVARSMRAIGQLSPGTVTLVLNNPQYDCRLVDGEHRLEACKQAKIKFLAHVKSELGEEERFVISVAANFNRLNHTCLQIMRACVRLKNQDRTIAEISDICGKSTTWVVQHLSLAKLHPDVQRLLMPSPQQTESELDGSEPIRDSKKLTFSLAQRLATFPHDIQKKAAIEITHYGMSLVKAQRYLKQLSRETGHAPTRKEKPSEKFGALRTLTTHSIDKFGVFLDMNPPEIEHMFFGKNPEEREMLVRMLSGFRGHIDKLIEKVKHPPA